jgi:asparagine synthase (glutamine-hydrolysing)
MTDIQTHRGPDGRGVYFDDHSGVGLGHRRLSIIDLSTGNQPMCNEDGSIWVVFNGEIYTFRNLRSELEEKGHTFHTASDTEVIVHAYEEWGLECPARFNGIFAFAVWDSKKRKLYLARDHYGVKPLYFTCRNGDFRFASEIKALLVDLDLPREVNLDALNLCLNYRFCPAPWTLFRGVYKLVPAGYILVDTHGIHQGFYWDEKPEILRAGDEAKWILDLRDRFDQAVRRQLVSDVPVGLSLSSGVDSSALLALMQHHLNRPVKAFTIGFEGKEVDNEIQVAQRIAHHFKAETYVQMIREQDYVSFMDSYIWHLEEPIVNQSAMAYYFVAKMAREHGVKVLLNGQGPDEAFAGYDRHLGAVFVSRFTTPGLAWIARKMMPLTGFLPIPERYQRLLSALSVRNELEMVYRIYSIMPELERQRMLSGAVLDQIDPDLPRQWLSDQWARTPEGSVVEKMTYFEARTILSEELLLAEDKMSMAASVEARVPYLDLEVMKFVETLPGSVKVKGRTQKFIHKQACLAWLPHEVVYCRKIGFVSAVDLWLRRRLGMQLQEIISDPESLTHTYLNPVRVQSLLQRHRAGRLNLERILFLLLSLEFWHTAFFHKMKTEGRADN